MNKKSDLAQTPAGALLELLSRAETVLSRLEAVLPSAPTPMNWQQSPAYRWRRHGDRGVLEPIMQVHRIALRDLQGIAEQKTRVERNTVQFVQGYPANNVLLTGARGTGKSSLIKALLNKYASRGLRLIEVEKRDLTDLPLIVELICQRPERYILYCDDLSFEADDPGYKALKVVLDGSIAAASENCLIYATSNRRHLMPEFIQENLEYQHVGEEIHPGETSEEKISLSERFGMWVSFHAFDQDEFLRIVQVWLRHFKLSPKQCEGAERAALQWALERSSRSGRVAWQFARDWAGQVRLADKP
jgi:hypothetical protein